MSSMTLRSRSPVEYCRRKSERWTSTSSSARSRSPVRNWSGGCSSGCGRTRSARSCTRGPTWGTGSGRDSCAWAAASAKGRVRFRRGWCANLRTRPTWRYCDGDACRGRGGWSARGYRCSTRSSQTANAPVQVKETLKITYKLIIFVILLSRALPSVGMYFLYMRCHAVLYSSLYKVSIICNQSLLYLWRILVIYFVFMEIWRIEPRKDLLFPMFGWSRSTSELNVDYWLVLSCKLRKCAIYSLYSYNKHWNDFKCVPFPSVGHLQSRLNGWIP